MTDKRQTTLRLGDDDRASIARLCEMTGLDSAAAAIRLAVREAVAMREQVMPARPRAKKRVSRTAP